MARRRSRMLATAGLTLALTGGVLSQGILSHGALAARQDAATPSAAACRTVLQGEQTTPSLIDTSQFVPVSQITGSAAPAATASATATPKSTTTPAAPVASPVAGERSTATATATVTTTATAAANSSGGTDEDLRELAFAIINCTSQDDFTALGSLVTDTYLSQTFAGGDQLSREDLLALAAVTVVPQQNLLAFDNITVNGNTATAEVIYTSGNQLLHEEWSFIAGSNGAWQLDSSRALEPLAPADAVTTNVTINKRIKTDPRDVAGGDVVLLGVNKEKVDHEMLVLRLPTGATTELLLQQPGPGLPDGVEFIGQMTVPAGGEAVLPLIDLAPGNYVVVCMLLDDNGAPYLASGYKARLVVGS